jgi:hypothetical protein
MSAVTIIVICVFALVILCACYGLTVKYLDQRDLQKDARTLQSLIKPKANDWDDEFLRSVANEHELLRIEPIKYWYKQNKSKTYDGMRWYCKCGATNFHMSLAIAELQFEGHKKDKRDAALASLGRFK